MALAAEATPRLDVQSRIADFPTYPVRCACGVRIFSPEMEAKHRNRLYHSCDRPLVPTGPEPRGPRLDSDQGGPVWCEGCGRFDVDLRPARLAGDVAPRICRSCRSLAVPAEDTIEDLRARARQDRAQAERRAWTLARLTVAERARLEAAEDAEFVGVPGEDPEAVFAELAAAVQAREVPDVDAPPASRIAVVASRPEVGAD